MRRLLMAGLLFCGVASAMQRVQVTCSKGGQTVTVLTYTSTTKVQASYPGCSATVYITGSSPLTKATIFSDNLGTALSNPFTTQDATNGAGYFYVADGYYDVQVSGGGLNAPYTFGAINAIDSAYNAFRTKESKLADTVSVKDFGARCDGLTDDSVPLQNAINAAEISGAELMIPAPSICAYSTTLLITGAIRLAGDNETQAAHFGSGLLYTGNSIAILVQNGTNTIYRVRLERFRLYSSGTAGDGIQVVKGSECYFDRLAINDEYYVHGSFTNNLHIQSSSLIFVSGDGSASAAASNSAIFLDNSYGPVFISGQNLYDNATHVLITESNFITISNTWMEWSGDGILLSGAAAANVSSGLTLDHVRIVTGPTSPFSASTCIRIADSASNAVIATQWRLQDVWCRIDQAPAPVAPVQIAFSNVGSAAQLEIDNSIFDGGAASINSVSVYPSQSNIEGHLNTCETTLGVAQACTSGNPDFYSTSFVSGNLLHAGSTVFQGISGTGGVALNLWGLGGGDLLNYEQFDGARTAYIGHTTPSNGGFVISNAESASGDIFIIPKGQVDLAATSTAVGPTPFGTAATQEIRNSAGATTQYITQGAAQGTTAPFIIYTAGGIPETYELPGGTWTTKKYASSGTTFSGLGTPNSGWMIWCSDCAVTTPCTGSGAGAWAFGSAGGWKCPF
jgi:hypothetical protein